MVYGPSQVAFFSYLSDHARGLGHQQVVPFDTVKLNAGNAFDPTTHTFICPTDGVYVFQSALMAEFSDMVQTQIVVDGAAIADMYAGGSPTTFDQGFNSLVTLCRRGQRVWVRNLHDRGHNIYPFFYTTFSGYLLFEIEATGGPI